ncbi:hypothetical protein [Chitinimonas koreensis]|uniref:hypothetical protein n=1 Tax=Chitinimonas koreensis TaxID=356302 RepID=UPI0027E5B9A5|nr:hypothetical protein [Chitinimonas koreensis]
MAGTDMAALDAEVVRLEDLGTVKLLTARLAGQQIKVKLGEHERVEGERVRLNLAPERTMFYADGQRVA